MSYASWDGGASWDNELTPSGLDDQFALPLASMTPRQIKRPPSPKQQPSASIEVGFWREVGEYAQPNGYTDLPQPNSAKEPQQRLVSKLVKIEAKAREVIFKGLSPCRICGCNNGAAEYTYKGFRWPDGYKHYLLDHNVACDARFRTMIANEQL